MSYIAPWKTHYNLDHIEAVQDVSNTIKPGYYQAKEDRYRNGWLSFISGRKYIETIKGRFYTTWGSEEETTRKDACYSDHCLMVWTSNDKYGNAWNFNSREELENFLNQFDSHKKGCNFEPSKPTS